MRRTTISIPLLLLAVSMLHANTYQQSVDSLIQSISPALRIGVQVVDLTNNTILYTRNAEEGFIPASNMKLFSDAAALMALGPDYRFQNQLDTDASSIKNKVLQGSIFLNLPGDPSFKHENLRELISQLRAWNVQTIKGNFYIVSPLANLNPYPNGWVKKDYIFSYAAPISPLMIDRNRLMITLNPGNKVGDKAFIEITDPSKSITLNNQVITQPKGQVCGIAYEIDKNNQITAKGCLALGQWAVLQPLAVQNPLKYAEAVIQEELNTANIKLEGNILLGQKPMAHRLLLAQTLSKPVAQLIADTLKPSDNLYADSLFLHAAYRLKGAEVSWLEAENIVKKFLEKQTGIDLRQALMADGSGLSRQDVLTPKQTVALLKFLYHSFPLTYEYIAALPVSGRDGTLEQRFNHPQEQDLIRAKTGTMKGVVSLSGYLSTLNRHTLAFAIFINQMPKAKGPNFSSYYQLVDNICKFFLKQQPKNLLTEVKSPIGESQMAYSSYLTQAIKQRKHMTAWRALEGAVKQKLAARPVHILFRPNELLIHDNSATEKEVLSELVALKKQHAFSLVLMSHTPPKSIEHLFWIGTISERDNAKRTWMLRAEN